MRLGLKDSGTPRIAVVFMTLAVLILAVTLAFAVLTPAHGGTTSLAARAKSRRDIQRQTEAAAQQAAQAEAYVAARMSVEGEHGAAARVMASVEAAAKRRGLKVTAFRPQRTRVVDDLLEVPFVTHISGAFPAVHSLLYELDSGGMRMVLRSVQLAAAEETPGGVTAVVGITTYTTAPVAQKGKAR